MTDVVKLVEALATIQAALDGLPDARMVVEAPDWKYQPLNEKTALLAGWLGLDGVAPAVVETDDGPFQAYPAQFGPDFGWIMRGCKNVRSKTWNAKDLTGPWAATGADDPELNRIRAYRGGLRSDPNGWPEPYRTAFLESHPEFKWDGVTKPDTLTYWTTA